MLFDKDIKDKKMNFIDTALNNHIEMYLDGKNHAFEVDLDSNAGYFNNSKFDLDF